MRMEPTFIFGRHAVVEALRKRPGIIDTLYIRDSYLKDPEINSLVKKIKDVRELGDKKLPQGFDRHHVHQGIIAVIDTARLLIPFKTFKQELVVTENTALAILGEIQDPHNVGAIIRSAAAFGISAVLIPKHRQAPVTGTVIKVSTGTAFSLPLVNVGNVNNAIRDLKELGFWVYGLDMKGDTNLPEEDFRRPSVFVVGNEAGGMREKTHELCDSILTIPMSNKAESLNASVSAATVMYAWSSKHLSALNSDAN